MAVAITGSVNTQNQPSASADATLTFSSTTYGAGELLVVIVCQNAGSTAFPSPGTPSGGGLSWTQILDIQGTAGNFVRTTAWWADTGAGGTYSITQTTTRNGAPNIETYGARYRLTGANLTTPVGATDTHQGTAAEPLLANTNLQLTTASAGSMLFAAATDWSATSATVDLDSGLTDTTDTNTTTSDATYLIFRSNALAGDDNDVRAEMNMSAGNGNWAAMFFEIEQAVAAATVQLNPISDVATNSWTNQAGSGTNIYQSIDENVADDSDYVQSAIAATSGSYYETELETGDDPVSSSNHTVHYRYRAFPPYASTDVTVSLREGSGTEIDSWSHTGISGTWTDGSRTLDGTDTDAITDYADLRIRFAPTGAGAQTPALVANSTGTASNLTSQASTNVTVSAGMATAILPGHYMVAWVAVDNSGTNGARPGLTVTDSRSHTWTVTAGALQDPGAANAGAACYIAYTKVTTAYQTNDTITFTWGTNAAGKSIRVSAFTGVHQTSPVGVTEVAANNGNTAFTISITPNASNQLVVVAGAIEGASGDTWTDDADSTNGTWTAGTEVSTGNTGATDMTLQSAFKVVSASGAQTWNSTITNRDWAANAIVFAPDTGSRVQISWADMTIPDIVAAGVATATGAANNATLNIAPTGGSGSGTGSGNTSSGLLAPIAAVATATGTANNSTITASSNLPTGVAEATGAGNNSSLSIGVSAGTTDATGAANNATVTASSNLSAGVATATGAANTASPSIATNGGSGSGTGTGNGSSGTIQITAGTTDATGAANDATVSTNVTDTNVNAGVATATGAANGSTLTITTNSGTGTGSGAAVGPAGSLRVNPVGDPLLDENGDPLLDEDGNVLYAGGGPVAIGRAYDATITESLNTNVNAEVATATGAANGSTVTIATNGGTGASSGQANGSSGALQATPATATATGTAHNATPTTESIANVDAQVATATGAANNATITITATIGAATATGDSYGPAISINSGAGVGTGTGTGNNSNGSGGTSPSVATATGAANGSTVTIVIGSGVATATGTAHNADTVLPTVFLSEILAEVRSTEIEANVRLHHDLDADIRSSPDLVLTVR